jgi:hypothetical protein
MHIVYVDLTNTIRVLSGEMCAVGGVHFQLLWDATRRHSNRDIRIPHLTMTTEVERGSNRITLFS